MPKKHGLGWGNSRIIEYEDGSAGYVPSAGLTQAFRVQIADITGFSVSKGNKMLERTFNVLGNGTLLASASVNHGTSEVLENWFRSHPLFGTGSPSRVSSPPERPSPAPGISVADELRKLADLRAQGVLTEAEFTEQKRRLLNP
jgi:hypothetical protein